MLNRVHIACELKLILRIRISILILLGVLIVGFVDALPSAEILVHRAANDQIWLGVAWKLYSFDLLRFNDKVSWIVITVACGDVHGKSKCNIESLQQPCSPCRSRRPVYFRNNSIGLVSDGLLVLINMDS